MRILDVIDGCLDAGDVAGAAAGVLAHPSSRRLDRSIISKLFAIAYGGEPAHKVDEAMISLMRDVAAIDEECAQ